MLKVQSGAYAIILSSLLMISIGIVLFVKFLKKYPLPSMEAKNGLKTT
jgi:hypothetical protein